MEEPWAVTFTSECWGCHHGICIKETHWAPLNYSKKLQYIGGEGCRHQNHVEYQYFLLYTNQLMDTIINLFHCTVLIVALHVDLHSGLWFCCGATDSFSCSNYHVGGILILVWLLNCPFNHWFQIPMLDSLFLLPLIFPNHQAVCGSDWLVQP